MSAGHGNQSSNGLFSAAVYPVFENMPYGVGTALAQSSEPQQYCHQQQQHDIEQERLLRKRLQEQQLMYYQATPVPMQTRPLSYSHTTTHFYGQKF